MKQRPWLLTQHEVKMKVKERVGGDETSPPNGGNTSRLSDKLQKFGA